MSCFRSQNILQDIQKTELFLAPKGAQCITASQPTQKSTDVCQNMQSNTPLTIYTPY